MTEFPSVSSSARPLASDWRTWMGDEPFTERTPRIVNAAKLHRAAARKKAGRFLAEGANAVSAALRYGDVVEVYLTEQGLESIGARFDQLTGDDVRGVRVHLITDRASSALSESVSPTGIFALCLSQLVDLSEAVQGDLVAVPVETSEPGNAGALVRVADASGAASVVFAGSTVDPQGGKAVRSSAGSLFHLPVARHTGVADVVDLLHERGYTVLATAGDGDISLDAAAAAQDGDVPLLGQKIAWLFGNEAHGLGDWQDLADVRVSIPMGGKAESLNLVTAAAICLYETARVARGA
ncbi:Putative rRNA methyltransferase [Corynebacterium glyciniphilum AJ 3170]|uniref:Putative rRNA methyltransferase n=1 Tax=Corynebacterium glyciniphilum AJ 3170 TaxID=1404245 RepID=X5DUI9_9CORY|nr:Putative rRNA methyltransferase [Corynebacterium glyciniphilum AJ 3170]